MLSWTELSDLICTVVAGKWSTSVIFINFTQRVRLSMSRPPFLGIILLFSFILFKSKEHIHYWFSVRGVITHSNWQILKLSKDEYKMMLKWYIWILGFPGIHTVTIMCIVSYSVQWCTNVVFQAVKHRNGWGKTVWLVGRKGGWPKESLWWHYEGKEERGK